MPDAIGPEKLLEVKRIHIHNRLIPNRDGVFSKLLLGFFLLLFTVTFHTEQRTCGYDIIPAVDLERFQCGSGIGAVLNLIENQACFVRYEFRFGHNCGEIHHHHIHLFRTGESSGFFRLECEVDVNNTFVVHLRKMLNNKGFSALPYSFYDQRFVVFCVLPFDEDILNLSLQHNDTIFSACKNTLF